MTRLLVRVFVVAPALAAALGVADPAAASEPGPPFEYVRCYDVTVEAPGKAPVLTVCSPV
jgi:hypothetical protein